MSLLSPLVSSLIFFMGLIIFGVGLGMIYLTQYWSLILVIGYLISVGGLFLTAI